ncbi:MAG TPA: TAT-variant-translocated molybdopterin oxidoreductase [Tepidisphaeraceae bacterium]|nr:TAT-variant-translocated molybdopterin oxidoreductase [Tepidisphaeraceae bacterium]
MSQVNHHVTGPQYWRSLEQLSESPEVLAQIEKEFPGYDPEQIRGLSRRRFMKLMAASMALAGIGLTGCRRWPEETLVPQSANPEGRIPGLSEHYATVMELGGVGHGLLAVSYEGRPIKIEGNPLHPMSRVTERYGSADALAQASVLELYDPDRSRGVVQGKGQAAKAVNWQAFRAAAPTLFAGNGANVAILHEACSGPTFADLRKRFLAKFPQAKFYEYEPVSHDNERLATRLAFGQVLRPRLHLEKADVVVSLDCDFLGAHPAHTRYANDWVQRRKSADRNRSMSRVYVAESVFSITGAVADARLPLKPSRVTTLAWNLAARLGVGGAKPVGELTAEEGKFLDALAADLRSAGKNAVVAAGSHLPPETQAITMAINAALGSIGNTITFLAVPDADRPTHAEAVAQLAKQIQGGGVQTLLILGGNPAYDAPAEVEFEKLLGTVANAVHLSGYYNETSKACAWHLPKAHYLESWGDARAYDGTVSVQQPLIEPLFGGMSSIELLALLAGDDLTGGRALVRRTLEPMLGGGGGGGGGAGAEKDKAFNVVLHDGIVANTAAAAANVTAQAVAQPNIAGGDAMEVRFIADPTIYDGRFANNGWLQETPDPLSKLTWDNAAMISKIDADKLGVASGDLLTLPLNGKSLQIAAYILPGQPVGVITLPLGYGRRDGGNVGTGVGFDVYPVRTANQWSAALGGNVAKAGGTYKLATTQEHHIIDPVGFAGREARVGEKHKSGIVVRETTLAEFKQNPRSAHPHGHGDLRLQLFDPPHVVAEGGQEKAFTEPHAWGMAVDMTACIGCNACVVACVSENNIPVVGKVEVAVNREMHWIRIDRYFKGAIDDPNPEVAFQPMMCVHCENAPCEQVCPVAATVHDTEGLNTMVYNRCIGTRYCSNNCPYKVRRFNYFDWHSLDPRGGRFPAPWLDIPDTQQNKSVNPIKAMVFNPEVTVRMRGVMEKCTYCTQRIAQAKIKAKNDHLAGGRPSDVLADGEVLTACQQACPTQAIIFGNLNDRAATVTQLHKSPRAYSVLEELNTRPRTQYLAKVRNPAESLDAIPAGAGTGQAVGHGGAGGSGQHHAAGAAASTAPAASPAATKESEH